MANALYPAYKAALLDNGVDLISGNVKVTLIDTNDDTWNSADDFYDDILAGAKVATSGNLDGKTNTGGVFDSNNPTFTAASGDQSEALLLWRDSGTPATSELVAWYDTGVTGLPVTPNGGDINVTVNAAGWFAL